MYGKILFIPCYSKKGLSSSTPAITITPESSPSKGSFKSKIREANVKRNDSINRSKSFNKKYELSPDLQERSTMLLERKYGGKEKAHHSAKVIQSYYRKYAMDKQFKKIRAYTETPDKTLKADNIPQVQTTPVLRLVKKHVTDRNNKVRSTLIIDNIAPYTTGGQMNLARHFESVKNEEKPYLVEDQSTSDDDGQCVSVTENYMKVEVVDRIAESPVFGIKKPHIANGVVPSVTSKRTTSAEESDEG